MTNLTEQWNKGKLPEGWYWVEGSRAEGIYAYTAEYLNNMYRPRNGERVVEQVPSYREWQAKLEENTKLKELLKECHDILYEMSFKLKKVTDIDKCCEARKKIRDVLGEEYGFQKITHYIRNRAKDLGEE